MRLRKSQCRSYGGAGPLGPEASAACLPQPALRSLANRVAGRGSQQRAPHALCVSKGESQLFSGDRRWQSQVIMNPSLMSSLLPCARQALRSLQRYPLPLRSGKEAKILQHFGDRLCRMLDEKLKEHLASGGEHLWKLVI